jgi:hypothetical protein
MTTLTKIEPISKLKIGDRIKIVSLNRNFMGSLINGYIKKFEGRMGTVADIIFKKSFPILVQPDDYKGYIFVKENEVERI